MFNCTENNVKWRVEYKEQPLLICFVEVHYFAWQDDVCAIPVKVKRWEVLSYSKDPKDMLPARRIYSRNSKSIFHLFFQLQGIQKEKSRDTGHMFSSGPGGGYVNLLAPALPSDGCELGQSHGGRRKSLCRRKGENPVENSSLNTHLLGIVFTPRLSLQPARYKIYKHTLNTNIPVWIVLNSHNWKHKLNCHPQRQKK